MDADFSIELGADDAALEIPWNSADGKLQYLDLKRQPELLASLPEGRERPELWRFLATVNSAKSEFASAKCDAWLTGEQNAEDEVYGKALKMACYVDLFFTDARRYSFEEHERLVRGWAERLRQRPEFAASAEFIVRRCYFRAQDRADIT